MQLVVGQEVYAAWDITQAASGDSPFMVLADRGDLLIVRSVPDRFWDVYVSHPERTDNSFGVHLDEIRQEKPR